MSALLWRYYLEDDLDSFRKLLGNATSTTGANSSRSSGGSHTGSIVYTYGSSTKGLSTSPRLKGKGRTQGSSANLLKYSKGSINPLTRADINSKDQHGIALLHHIASSPSAQASLYASAFLKLPLLDSSAQDLESGWTPLHRALYSGNVTIARFLMDRDAQDTLPNGGSNSSHVVSGLIKVKDREGNAPFDVYNSTITSRSILGEQSRLQLAHATGSDWDASSDEADGPSAGSISMDGDELFMFGSNKNLTLGFGDEDDRQYPERISLRRIEHLQQRLREGFGRRPRSIGGQTMDPATTSLDMSSIPAVIRYKPTKIRDVQLSKLHSAVLIDDEEANLYICGFGAGGRLGTGSEAAQFTFRCIDGGGLLHKAVASIGLGLNHTIAVTRQGEVFTWGSNTFGQLGYSISASPDQDSMQLLPRQIFGPLKREMVLGCAASKHHSMVFTASSLFCFGKNEGQLGLMDADARSLEYQAIPRRIAASLLQSPLVMVSAIEKATTCLLENHEVWVFANYGYTKINFSLDGLESHFLRGSFSRTRYDDTPNHICKIRSAGDTICALARQGDVFTFTISPKLESLASTSTTNPAKIKGALSAPQQVWSLRKDHMAATDVDVGQDGSIIICTAAGSVWKRVRRVKIEKASLKQDSTGYLAKNYKFSRIPGLTNIIAVKSNAFGAFAAVRKDCHVLKTQLEVTSPTLWQDLFPLFPLEKLDVHEDSDTEEPSPRFWTPHDTLSSPSRIRRAILTNPTIEEDIKTVIADLTRSMDQSFDLRIASTASDVIIPCHEFMLSGRSSVLMRALSEVRQSYYFQLPDILSIEYDKEGHILIKFDGLDLLTMVNLVFYIYTDGVIDVWHHVRRSPEKATRYRQIRTELMRIASQLDMPELERSVRLMTEPTKILHRNFEDAVALPSFFDTGDIVIELEHSSMQIHSALVCRRCPFFETLFHGRSGGNWITSRRDASEDHQAHVRVDLMHVNFETFQLILRFLYAETAATLFDDVVKPDLDSFLDLVMDVLSVANELMLDRLALVCQELLGKYVNMRNVCQILNAVAACSVTDFKVAALEYICLNLEGMLENHLLDELDDDLMLELDGVVRENQLSLSPVVRSGQAEAHMREEYPEYGQLLERDRQIKIDSMALKARVHEVVPKMQHIHGDLMFDMDDEAEWKSRKPPDQPAPAYRRDSEAGEDDDQIRSSNARIPSRATWAVSEKGMTIPPSSPTQIHLAGLSMDSNLDLGGSNRRVSSSFSMLEPEHRSRNQSKPWIAADLTAPKLDMKNIMAQASANRQSNISSALSQQSNSGTLPKPNSSRLSQRERKKQQQEFLGTSAPRSPLITPLENSLLAGTPPSPWRTASTGPRVSIKDLLEGEPLPLSSSANSRLSPSSSPALTMRQTIPGNAINSKSRHNAHHPPSRSISTPIKSMIQQSTSISTSAPSPSPSLSSPTTAPLSAVRSIRHHLPQQPESEPEPALALSMADILAQQQTEKDVRREIETARRSLHEIQEEQAFQEWWDQEEAATRARLRGADEPGRGNGDGKGVVGTEEAQRGREGRIGRGRGKVRRGGGGGLGGLSGGGSGHAGIGRERGSTRGGERGNVRSRSSAGGGRGRGREA